MKARAALGWILEPGTRTTTNHRGKDQQISSIDESIDTGQEDNGGVKLISGIPDRGARPSPARTASAATLRADGQGPVHRPNPTRGRPPQPTLPGVRRTPAAAAAEPALRRGPGPCPTSARSLGAGGGSSRWPLRSRWSKTQSDQSLAVRPRAGVALPGRLRSVRTPGRPGRSPGRQETGGGAEARDVLVIRRRGGISPPQRAGPGCQARLAPDPQGRRGGCTGCPA